MELVPVDRYALQNGQLVLDGRVAPVVFFHGYHDDPWFKAKPIHEFLGGTTVTQTLERVEPDDKASLKDLAERLGPPVGGVVENTPPPNNEDYNEGKAIYVNESGLYSIILGSRKPLAKPFKRWVTQQVLPSIRRTGGYSVQTSPEVLHSLSEQWQLALQKRDEALQLALQKRDEALQLCLQERDEALQTWMQTDLLQLLSQAVCFSLSQKFKDLRDEIRTVLTSPSSSFIEAIRTAVKLPAMRRTSDGDRFPEEQRVTPDEERFAESLSALLTQELERLVPQSAIFGRAARVPALTYGAWKRCRNLIGSRCLALRKLTGDASKPLLWTTSAGAGGRFNGGGQHYLYLSESRAHVGGDVKAYLRKVLKQKLKRSRTSVTVEQHIRRLIATTPPENWPVSSGNVDAFTHDASEEQMGREMVD